MARGGRTGVGGVKMIHLYHYHLIGCYENPTMRIRLSIYKIFALSALILLIKLAKTFLRSATRFQLHARVLEIIYEVPSFSRDNDPLCQQFRGVISGRKRAMEERRRGLYYVVYYLAQQMPIHSNIEENSFRALFSSRAANIAYF